MKTEDMLKALTEAPGISGAEDDVAHLLRNYFARLTDEAAIDKFQNVIGVKKGRTSGGKLMMAAHIDQIGFIVKTVDKGGFLRLAAVGGHDPRVLPGQSVVIYGREQIRGIIGTTPPHLQKPGDTSKVTSLDDLYVDTGLEEEMVKKKIRIGDPILFDNVCTRLQGGLYTAAAMDNRAGVLVLLETLKILEKMKHDWDIYMVGTVQEEVGTRGAAMTAYEISPDVGVAIDVTFGDFPGIPERDTAKLGKGGAIAVGPNFHPGLTERLMKLAEDWEVPFQKEFNPRPGGTDAVSMQIAGRGVPMVQVSIPLRYMHTTVETLDVKDIKRSARLLALFSAHIEQAHREVVG